MKTGLNGQGKKAGLKKWAGFWWRGCGGGRGLGGGVRVFFERGYFLGRSYGKPPFLRYGAGQNADWNKSLKTRPAPSSSTNVCRLSPGMLGSRDVAGCCLLHKAGSHGGVHEVVTQLFQVQSRFIWQFYTIQFNSLFHFTQVNANFTVYNVTFIINKLFTYSVFIVTSYSWLILFATLCMSLENSEGFTYQPCSTLEYWCSRALLIFIYSHVFWHNTTETIFFASG